MVTVTLGFPKERDARRVAAVKLSVEQLELLARAARFGTVEVYDERGPLKTARTLCRKKLLLQRHACFYEITEAGQIRVRAALGGGEGGATELSDDSITRMRTYIAQGLGVEERQLPGLEASVAALASVTQGLRKKLDAANRARSEAAADRSAEFARRRMGF